MSSGPPFASIDQALTWAFRVAAVDIGSISSIYRRREADRHQKAEWSPFERHGQAGAILGFADQVLDEREKVYVLARYGRLRECEDRVLEWAAATLGTGVHQRRALRSVWLMHCGARIGRQSLTKELGLGTNWRPAMAFKGDVLRRLGDVTLSVYKKLEPKLVEKRIVEYSENTS